MGGIYLWWTTINVLAFAWSLKKLRVLLPNWSTLAHIPIAFCMIVFLDAILEIPATRFGLFAYPGAPYSLTLWAEKADGAVWISTYTKALQRQLDRETERIYSEPATLRRKEIGRAHV